MEALLQKHYNIVTSEITTLDGYISENYKIKTEGEPYVLKVYPFSEAVFEDVMGEVAFVKHVSLNKRQISHTLPNLNGELLTITEQENQKIILRLLTFIEGDFLANTEHTKDLVYEFGKHLGQLDKELKSFKNNALQSRRLEWNLANLELIAPLSEHIFDPSNRKIVEHYISQWRTKISPIFPHLRHSIIHNDANDWNVLVQEDGFGLIDLGDTSYTAIICELAIAAMYIGTGKEDPIEWIAEMVKGYHEVYALEKRELNILYYLIAGRLVTSVCKSAEQAKAQPDKTYIQISENGAWQLLKKWIQVNPLYAQNEFYNACGFEKTIIEETNILIEKRHSLINRGVSISYSNPIQMDSAIFQYMFDKDGHRILDAYNNIPHVGHQHPKVVEAAQKQMSQLNTNTRYLYDSLNEYAEQLLDKFPNSLNKVYFVNSGSAASDLAIRLAQNFTNRENLGVVQHGYHGNTRAGIEISQYKYASKGGRGKSKRIIEATIPNVYRGQYRDEFAGQKYAIDFLEQAKSTSPMAAFIAEPIVGCGGQVPLADGYLRHLYPKLKELGTLCISDEVQTGFGRMGSHFWGFEMHGVTPDIVILGKPIGNGHPMGAVVTTTEISEAFNNGMEFFSSFGGNPVSCEIGKAVLDVIDGEDLMKNALEVGCYKKQLFNELKKDFPVIGDVRGSGLFLGIELIRDDNLKPNTELASRIKNELRMANILVSTDGPYDSVIKSKPPMCFNKDNAEELVDAFNRVLTTKK